jgi:hypothetical protein
VPSRKPSRGFRGVPSWTMPRPLVAYAAPRPTCTCVERYVSTVRKTWLSGIKKVVHAPPDHGVYVLATNPGEPAGSASAPGRIVSDTDAPGFRPEHADDIWPYKQKEAIEKINQRLKNQRRVNSHDIYCLRVVYDLERTRPAFLHRAFQRSSPQYSDAFVEWVVGEYTKDPTFLDRVRERFSHLNVTRPSKSTSHGGMKT